jgi:hypothetical protein
MINFFKNLWDKIKTLVSKHKLVPETIFKMLLAILFIAWAILMLYLFSEALLSGIEKQSPIHIAFAIAGYIFIAWYSYWITFANSQDDELHQIQRQLGEIRFRQRSSSLNNTLSRSEFRVSMLEKKMSDDLIKYKLEALERKLDNLIEQR